MQVYLYDPHPGYGGAMISLPKPIKKVVDSLNGKAMELNEAIEKIKEAAENLGYASVEVEAHDKTDSVLSNANYSFICLTLREGDPYPAHAFRAICFK